MRRATLFIDRPIATSLLMIACVIGGLFALRQLPVSALPTVDSPVIEVSTELLGANPEVIASTITNPLEYRFSEIPGLASMRSVSSFGASHITLEFSLTRNIDSAAQDVQAAISASAGQLPKYLPNAPVYSKVNPADAPILMLAITSDTTPPWRLGELAEGFITQKISQVDGVGLVSVGGGQKRALRIAVDARALAERGLTLDDIGARIRQFNVNAPKGAIEGAHQAFTLAADDQLVSAESYRDLIIASAGDTVIRLGDVAQVREGVEDERVFGWYGREPAIVVTVQRQPGANVIATVDRIKALLPKLRASLPAGIEVEAIADRTESIRASVAGVRDALLLAIVIVVLVIAVFLRRLWATLIPSAALPVSIISTFAVMGMFGYGIDNLSLMALTTAAGFVVDDAIVMVENIHRHIEDGAEPSRAAREGLREIAFTIVSLTSSLIAVFLPLLFMQGVVGRLFREFTVTLCVAIILSAVVSLTFTPMLSARFLSAREDGAREKGRRSWLGRIDLGGLYARSLARSLEHPLLVNGSTVCALLLTIALFADAPKGLLPVQDNGVIQAVVEAQEDISSRAFRALQTDVAAAILEVPDVANVQGFSGIGPNNPTPNTAQVFIRLKPHAQRSRSMPQIMARLQQAVAPIVGVRLFMQPSQELILDNRASRTQYQVSVQDADAGELALWTGRLAAALGARPEVRDVASDQLRLAGQVALTIHRDRAALIGVSVKVIDDALYNAFGQRIVSTIFSQSDQYHVVLEADPASRGEDHFLASTYVRTADDRLAPLASLVSKAETLAPLAITRLGRFPQATISFNLGEGRALSDAVRAVEASVAGIGLPERVSIAFSGAAAAFEAALENQVGLIIAAVGVVYIVLGILYESYIHPITILSTLPSACLGALVALRIGGYELDVFSFIGLILLIGIAKKNAIMMIDFALAAERAGQAPKQAILEACRLRFRPIMMTTMAAILGALPLAFDMSIGAELRRPLGVAIVGGMLVSQLLTLYSTPAVYVLFASAERRRRQGGGAGRRAAALAPAREPSP